MKQVSLFFIGLSFALSLGAQQNLSALTITVNGNKNLQITVDGRDYYFSNNEVTGNNTTILLNNLEEGQHSFLATRTNNINLDIRAQCSGFVYGLSVADAWIRIGQYRTILLVGVEIQSTGVELTNRGRDMAVLFGDGAGAAVLTATEEEGRGVLSTHIHADGQHAEVLWAEFSSSKHHPRLDAQAIAEGRHYPRMVGREVFKHAVARMPEAVEEAVEANGLTTADIDLLIPHQANLRITQMVQRRLGLADEKVVSNIERYGNTTAATIPIALAESVRDGRLNRGDLLCLVAFGSGFTWGSALIRW